MSQNRLHCPKSVIANTLYSCLVIILFIISSLFFLVTSFDSASAVSTQTQTSDADFIEGAFDNVTLLGVGEESHLVLAREFNWTKQTPPAKPVWRTGHEMAAVNGTDKFVLFGGFYDDSWNDYYLNDTWLYDLSQDTWTELQPKNSPSIRAFHGMAAVDNDDKIVLFGGHYYDGSNTYYYGDTWIYDLSQNDWSKKSMTTHPSNRSFHEMSTIHGTDKVLLYAGNYGGYETWVYELGTNKWILKSPPANPTSCSHCPAMAPISGTDKVLIFGGTGSFYSWWSYSRFTYVYDLSEDNWTYQSVSNFPYKRARHSIASISNDDKVVMFGGIVGGSSSGWTTLGDTWEFDLSECDWTRITLTTEPDDRQSPDMVSIYGRDEIVLFGGFGTGGSHDYKNDTWIYNLSSFKALGNYTSKPYHIDHNSTFTQLSWNASITAQASIKFQLRTALTNTSLEAQPFVGPDGSTTSYYTLSPSTFWSGHQQDKWLQYKAYFYSADKKNSAKLEDVTIWYNYWPQTTLTSPADNSIISNNKPKFEWTFIDQDSTHQTMFRVDISNDHEFTNINYTSDDQSTPDGFWQFPNGTLYTVLSDGSWYWKVRAKDNDGSWGEYSEPFKIFIDTHAPTSGTLSPENNRVYNTLESITGNATDPYMGTGVKKVELSIKRLKDDKYWSGSGWQTEVDWLLASGTNQWSFDAHSITWTSGTKYLVQTRAEDSAGNIEQPGTGTRFTYDSDEPMSMVSFPKDNAFLNSANIITGTAQDFGSSEIASVEITIQRASDNKYWSGTSWTHEKTWLQAMGTGVWSYDSSKVTWDSDVEYIIRSRGLDNGGNIEIPGPGNTFMFDDQPPYALMISINNDQKYTNSKYAELSLLAEDSGSGVYNMSFSTDGTQWTAMEPVGLSRAIILPPEDGEKVVYYKVQDRAGNIAEPVVDSIVLDTTAPTELSIVINNGAEFTNTDEVDLILSANDSLSGVSEMSFSSDGVAWTGWEKFAGERAFTLPPNDGEKTVHFRVKDLVDNVAGKTGSIILDTSPPHSLKLLINGGASKTNQTSVVLGIYASDELSGVDQISFSNDKNNWSQWKEYNTQETYELSPGDGEKIVYLRVKDKANNIAEPISAKILLNTTKKAEPTIDKDEPSSDKSLDIFGIIIGLAIIIIVIVMAVIFLFWRKKKKPTTNDTDKLKPQEGKNIQYPQPTKTVQSTAANLTTPRPSPTSIQQLQPQPQPLPGVGQQPQLIPHGAQQPRALQPNYVYQASTTSKPLSQLNREFQKSINR
ncbi:Kelch repeat-containing protein [[Eubacterium] cellulosolvens]